MLKLRLIRHPKPQVAPGVCYGATDLLAEEDALASQLDACLVLPKPALVLSSPLQRCAALAHGLAARGWPEPVIDQGFAEMNFGEWEMRAWSKIERQQIDAWSADISGYVPPGGESVRQVAERALQALYRQWLAHDTLVAPVLADEGSAVVLICHSGVIQGLSHILTGKSWSEFKPASLVFGEVRDVLVPLAGRKL